MHEIEGNCPKYLKRGGNRKEGKGKKYFKKGGGKLSQGVGTLKRVGEWNPFMNYNIYHPYISYMAQLVPHPPFSNFCFLSPLFYSIFSKVFQTVPPTLMQIIPLLSKSDTTTFLLHTHRLIFRQLNAKP